MKFTKRQFNLLLALDVGAIILCTFPWPIWQWGVVIASVLFGIAIGCELEE